jgi:hypothetical protein
VRRARWLAIAVLFAAMTPADAGAQQPAQPQQPSNPAGLPPRTANYHWKNDAGGDPTTPRKDDILFASFSYRDVLADPALMNKLSSGLWMDIVMRAYVYRDGEDTPIALPLRVCRARYDIWDEVYETHLSETQVGQAGRDKDQAVANTAGVLRVCTEALDLQIVRRELLNGKGVFLGVVVEVNPISAAMIEQMRRWIARPTGSTGIGPGDALFGGFVQLFVRQIATSDMTLTFRTQLFAP